MQLIVKNGKPVTINGKLLNKTGNKVTSPTKSTKLLVNSDGKYVTINNKLLYKKEETNK